MPSPAVIRLLASLLLATPLLAVTATNTFSTAGFSGKERSASPVLHAGGRVSFAYHAPGAREVAVSVGEAEPRKLLLARQPDGWWTGTLDPLAAGLHAYVFVVDGTPVIDPLNPRVKYGTVVYSSTLEIPGRTPHYAAIQEGVPQGARHILRYRSSSQQRYQMLQVHLPAAYATEPMRRFPVLYLRHGGGDDEHSWMQDGRAGAILDNLIAAKRAEPMIIVTTNGMTDGSWSHASSPAGMRLLEDELLHDVLPLIERSYRVSPEARHRALAGLSMGGGQAFVIGLRHVDTFAWIAQFSSGLLADKDLDLVALAPALTDAARVNAALQLLWIGCGREDPRYPGHLELMNALRGLGVRAEFHDGPGAHEWTVWRDQLHALLPVLFK